MSDATFGARVPILLLAGLAWGATAGAEGVERSLFNGRDLTGWETFLSVPQPTVKGLTLKTNEKGEYAEVIGVDRDPKGVYTVVTEDGRPAIRISGEIFGVLCTREPFENYHLRFEFKWGERKWPPRLGMVRDSGVLYHCTGPHGVMKTSNPQCQECQIQEGDCGDYWGLGGAIVDVEGELVDGKPPVHYKKGAETIQVPQPHLGGRIVKDADHEKPHGEWNVIDVYCLGRTSVHVVNGRPVMVLKNSRRKAVDADGAEKVEPLSKGRIAFQSEGSELFYRDITIRPITAFPKGVHAD